MGKIKKVSFWARKPIKVPTKVSFKTKAGKNVSFKARKTIKIKRKVSFLARR